MSREIFIYFRLASRVHLCTCQYSNFAHRINAISIARTARARGQVGVSRTTWRMDCGTIER
jgi:hypothetical protein